MERIKKLAVQGQKLLINIIKFLSLVQEMGENVVAFVVRLKGQASLCSFKVKCSCDMKTYVAY